MAGGKVMCASGALVVMLGCIQDAARNAQGGEVDVADETEVPSGDSVTGADVVEVQADGDDDAADDADTSGTVADGEEVAVEVTDDVTADADGDADGGGGALGGPCDEATPCLEGLCVEGRCCESACDGACESCADDGRCEPIAAGSDPDEECTASEPATCGPTGTCNGRRACDMWSGDWICGVATCGANLESSTASSRCDGAGGCATGATSSCAPYRCAAEFGLCRSTCDVDAHCANGWACDADDHQCRLANGSACDAARGGADCASGRCVDGMCCDSACAGPCESCQAGVCTPAPANEDPDEDCVASSAASCGNAGFCDGAGACALWPSTVECSPQACLDDVTSIGTGRCNGAGECSSGAVSACGAYACDAATGGCRDGCRDGDDCAPGWDCVTGGICKGLAGTACGGDGDCVSGACCTGVCRDVLWDVSHCGECGHVCGNDHGSTACTQGECDPSCDGGWMSCDDDPDDGCERSVRTLTDCGSCGLACTLPHAVATCATGQCEVTSCDNGWADCGTAAGCERQLDSCSTGCCTANDETGEDGSYIADGPGCALSRTLTGTTEGCFGFELVESVDALCAPTRARLDLVVPDGIDLELRVTVLSGEVQVKCTHLRSSDGTLQEGCVGENPVGDDERVYLNRPEPCLTTAGDLDSETFSIQVEVNWVSGRSCEMWTLRVNTGRDC